MDIPTRADRWRHWADRYWSGRAYLTLEDDAQHWPPGTRLLHASDSDYPQTLGDLANPPEFIYVRGHLGPGQRLAMVGTRTPNAEGCRLAHGLAAELARHGACVVSGGARGIDTVCHTAALQADGQTWAVLPGALDSPSPKQNAALFEQIVEARGALISEYPMGTPTRKHFFARRNALISALCEAVVVVRARPVGGSMLTVEAAERLGRQVYAVPGTPEDPTALGCLELIRNGQAQAAWTAAHLGFSQAKRRTKSLPTHPLLQRVQNSGAVSLDELASEANMDWSELLRWVLEWELAGLVFREGSVLRTCCD